MITVCAGPPLCLLTGDDAIAAQEAGCLKCERIFVTDDEPSYEAVDRALDIELALQDWDRRHSTRIASPDLAEHIAAALTAAREPSHD